MAYFGHNNKSSGSIKDEKFDGQLATMNFLRELCSAELVHDTVANNLKCCLKGRERF
jgi:hypothetical protein